MRQPKYEYKVEQISKWQNLEAKLNEFAKCGWEFVSFSLESGGGYSQGKIIVFRREVCNKEGEM